MNAHRKSFCFGLIALALTVVASASAQEDPVKYPTQPIRIVVGFAAGGGNDIIARIFGQKLSEDLGQPVIVENRPGGGAIVATEHVAESAPDGYTLLVGASGMAINPSLYSRLPYDSVRDFVAVSELATFPLILIVNASSPIKSVAELVAYAKANPDKTNYASSSASFQLVTELFKQKTGAPMQVIPYKSATESVTAVISGQVTTTIADAGPVLSQVQGGHVRALAIASPRQMAELPGVPTLKETGADVDGDLWTGVFAPKNTPPAVVKKLESEFIRIARLPEVISRLKPLGVEPVGSSSEEFTRILAADIIRWGEVAKAGNIKIEQ
ncbi:tripartite tricarboxylate transporter substrate binding protein [Bradyrhizobium sp.]|uniref:Bug family tripartite tricarboxylate transporter substrate binding protein n=1 Tax=Bradyrhizobium sp. TaxID=376 RepID=UPI0025B82CDF|nr:tripartite tricarboxylate transporter substrate binding protein [Bradyrhizobium sp.]